MAPPKPPDSGLWEVVTQDVTPLERGKRSKTSAFSKGFAPPETSQNRRKARVASVLKSEITLKLSTPTKDTKNAKDSVQMSAKQKKRHARGEIAAEATLDLHGKSLQSAFRTLKLFLLEQAAAGVRSVLVITGKGKPQDATGATMTIRQSLPAWVESDADLGACVLSYSPAQPKDGGIGAWYILLRRQRRPQI